SASSKSARGIICLRCISCSTVLIGFNVVIDSRRSFYAAGQRVLVGHLVLPVTHQRVPGIDQVQVPALLRAAQVLVHYLVLGIFQVQLVGQRQVIHIGQPYGQGGGQRLPTGGASQVVGHYGNGFNGHHAPFIGIAVGNDDLRVHRVVAVND